MATMKHGQYIARVDYDGAIGSFFGEVVNTGDTITFYGRSVDELHSEFARSVAAHIEFCARKGIEPGRPYSGRIPLRIPADLHRALAAEAAVDGISLNAYIAGTLAGDVREAD